MNDIVFSYDSMAQGFIFLKHTDIRQGIAQFHLVKNFDDVRSSFKRYGLAPWIENREDYNTYDEFVETIFETSITHETLHYVIANLEGIETCRKLDWLDHNEKLRRLLR